MFNKFLFTTLENIKSSSYIYYFLIFFLFSSLVPDKSMGLNQTSIINSFSYKQQGDYIHVKPQGHSIKLIIILDS